MFCRQNAAILIRAITALSATFLRADRRCELRMWSNGTSLVESLPLKSKFFLPKGSISLPLHFCRYLRKRTWSLQGIAEIHTLYQNHKMLSKFDSYHNYHLKWMTFYLEIHLNKDVCRSFHIYSLSQRTSSFLKRKVRLLVYAYALSKQTAHCYTRDKLWQTMYGTNIIKWKGGTVSNDHRYWYN